MAQTSYPFDGQTVTETQFSNFFKELQDTGVAGSSDGTGLKVSADSGGMRVFVAAGSAVVRGFFYNNDASVQLTIATASAALRYDRIVLRLDPSLNTAVLAVVQGSSGGGLPAVTQTLTGVYELPLATVTVGIGVVTIAAGNVADTRTYTGFNIGVWTTALRPASPRKFQPGFNSETALFEHWNGTAWVQSFATPTHTHTDNYPYRSGVISVPYTAGTTESGLINVGFSTALPAGTPKIALTQFDNGTSLVNARRMVPLVAYSDQDGFEFYALCSSGTFTGSGTAKFHYTAVNAV